MASNGSTKRPAGERTHEPRETSELSLEGFRASKHPALKRIAKRAAQNKRLSSYSSRFTNQISF